MLKIGKKLGILRLGKYLDILIKKGALAKLQISIHHCYGLALNKSEVTSDSSLNEVSQ